MGGVRLLNTQTIENHRNTLTELYLLNTKAHILTYNSDYSSAAKKVNELIGYSKENKALVTGCFDNDRLTGFMWVFPYRFKNEERYMINAIVVLPEYRKMRKAGKLFKAMESVLSEYKKPLYTCVDAVNSIAYHFYKSNDMEEENFQMVKRIKSE